MVLNPARWVTVLLLVAAAMSFSSAPAAAHKDHDRRTAAAHVAAGQSQSHPAVTPRAMPENMAAHAKATEEKAPRTISERLMSWVGRTHPFAVHFPIALFPVALVALVLARRRGETVELIRALIVVAGAASVIAGVLGWLTGGWALAADDAVHFWHRWLGTALALGGGAVAVWAYRQRALVFGNGMVAALAAITLLLLVQGWLGAALVHGMDHMNF